MKWLWPGPQESGITQSMIGKFLEDPFCFVLYYGLGLEEPASLPQNLMWGNVFHKGLEYLLPQEYRIAQMDEQQFARLGSVLQAEASRYNHIDSTTVPSVLEMLQLYPDSYKIGYSIATEQEFSVVHNTGNHRVLLKGKIDGIGEPVSYYSPSPGDPIHVFESINSPKLLVEHKSKETFDRSLFRKEAHTDLQLNFYLHAESLRSDVCEYVVYDNVRIPEVQWNCPPRQAGEKIAYYIKRLYHTENRGDFPVSKKSFVWIDQYIFHHPLSKVQLYFRETINPILDAMCFMYEYTLADSFDPFNPDCYNHLFYRKPLRVFDPARTSKFKKSYWNFLTGEIGLDGLVQVKELFKELSPEAQ